MKITNDISVLMTSEDVLSAIKEYSKLKGYLLSMGVDDVSDSDITLKMGIHTAGNISAIIKVKKDEDTPSTKDPASRDELIATLARAYKFIKSGANTHTNEKRIELEKEIEQYFN